MDAPERIRVAREKVGLTQAEVAKEIGISLSSYYDLEADEAEVEMNVSLRQLCALSHILNADPIWLLAGERSPMKIDIGLSSLPERIRQHLEETGLALSDFEEQAGWEISRAMSDGAAIWDWNVDCLKDVCRLLGIDWKPAISLRTNHHELGL